MGKNLFSERYIQATIGGIDIFTFPMRVKEIVQLSYVAVRGRDKEEGAVQRVLNRSRISSIKQYVLDGNMFVNTFVLNWTDSNVTPTFEEGVVKFPLIFSAAQLIDGQHRLEGLKEAMTVLPDIGNNSVLVSMVIRLSTKDAAKIFININSEQKPVPKSLIYDLYGITEDDKNFAITRAGDIAKELNENFDSPYYNLVKYPGSPRGKGKIDLSTIVSTLKSYVDVDGKFAENNIKDLNMQSQIIINYFSALKYFWEREHDLWNNATQNVFFKASGFTAAIDFFFDNVFSKCIDKKSFKKDFIVSMFDFSANSLIIYNDVKGSDGKTARKLISENLKRALVTCAPKEEEYEY